jgi:hypothetical protein
MRRAIYRYLPPVRWRMRASMMDYREAFYDAITDSTSALAETLREACKAMMRKHIPDRPDIWSKLTPAYELGCKRVIISDDYYPALANPKTTLETSKIKRILETGIELENGEQHNHDMIVLATGFQTSEFLFPIRIIGSKGRPLSEVWSSGPVALYGTTVPSLPNFGMFYGPNTNLGHNSIILMIEAQSRYLNTLVAVVLDARHRNARIGLMPKQSVANAYNDNIQSILEKTNFADPKCQSWYKRKDGMITSNWSGTVVEYQNILSRVNWEDFETTDCVGGKRSANEVVFGTGKKETRIGRVREETIFSNTTLALGAVSTLVAGMALYVGFWKRMKFGR